MKIKYLIFLFALSYGAPLAAQSEHISIDFSAFFSRYRKERAEVSAQQADVLLRRANADLATNRETLVVDGAGGVRSDLLHYSNRLDPSLMRESSAFEGVFSPSLRGAMKYDNGKGIGLEGGITAAFPSKARLERINYGLYAQLSVALGRNRGGRLFQSEATLASAQKLASEAALLGSEINTCADAYRLYGNAYVSEKTLQAYDELLKQKRRIYQKTAADYRAKLVTKFNFLAAQADYLNAQRVRPRYLASRGASFAELSVYLGRDINSLAQPPTLIHKQISFDSHPLFRQFNALIDVEKKRLDLIDIEFAPNIDLNIRAFSERRHDLFNPVGGIADRSDLGLIAEVEVSLPIVRPAQRYRKAAARASISALEAQMQTLRTTLKTQRVKAVVRKEQAERALEKLATQLRVARAQIAAAQNEFRNGRIEFQAFLNHWQGYQQAKLARYDEEAKIYLANAELVTTFTEPPSFCEVSR